MSRDASVKAQLAARLAELEAAGVDGLPRLGEIRDPRQRKAARAKAAATQREATPPRAKGEPATPPVRAAAAPAPVAADESWRSLGLPELASHLSDCARCKLKDVRRQVVFGVGNPDARLMFVGEGPGRDEDLQGEPFVGKAGQLLTDMIQKGMKLQRSEVYIANVVKCRPPENRDPEPDEVAACEGFLKRQVELIQPEVIVALGRFAAQCLLRTERPIGKLRGQWHEYEGIALMPTFHPAYLLRSPGEKRSAWADLKQVMRKLGLE